VLTRLEAQAAGIEDFEGRAQIRMWGMGPSQRAWLRLFCKAPDRIKLLVDGAFGIRVLELSLSGDRLRAYFPTSDRFIEEPSEAFWRNRVGMEIENTDVRDILLGTVSASPSDSMYVSEFRRTEEGYLLVVEKGAFVRKVCVDGWDLTPTEEEMWDRSGGFIGRRTMTHFKNVDGVRLPERIELTQGAHRIEITFLSRRVNRGFPDERLQLSMPEEREIRE
jgi:outer membrane lipoprotein-sorting protein